MAHGAAPNARPRSATSDPRARASSCASGSSDEGQGILAELTERVTRAVLHHQSRGQGHWLGLSMVAGFIAQSGGLFQHQPANAGSGTDDRDHAARDHRCRGRPAPCCRYNEHVTGDRDRLWSGWSTTMQACDVVRVRATARSRASDVPSWPRTRRHALEAMLEQRTDKRRVRAHRLDDAAGSTAMALLLGGAWQVAAHQGRDHDRQPAAGAMGRP